MTVIAGFQCRNGLLLCADTEQSLSQESKSQVRKIQTDVNGRAAMVIGGAGDGDVIDYIQYRLFRDFNTDFPLTLDEIEPWLSQFAAKMWHELVEPYGGFPREYIPDLSFLIGFHMKDSYRLYKWERNFVYPVTPRTHVSIGIGVVQSETLLSELDLFLPVDEMLLYAVRAMLKVKRLVQGCGGKTEMAFLHNEGIVIKPATQNIDALEALIDEVDEWWIERVLHRICKPELMQDESEVDYTDGLMRRFQEQYKALLPRFFKEVYGTF